MIAHTVGAYKYQTGEPGLEFIFRVPKVITVHNVVPVPNIVSVADVVPIPSVIPAKAGIQIPSGPESCRNCAPDWRPGAGFGSTQLFHWIPAFAGMTICWPG